MYRIPNLAAKASEYESTSKILKWWDSSKNSYRILCSLILKKSSEPAPGQSRQELVHITCACCNFFIMLAKRPAETVATFVFPGVPFHWKMFTSVDPVEHEDALIFCMRFHHSLILGIWLYCCALHVNIRESETTLQHSNIGQDSAWNHINCIVQSKAAKIGFLFWNSKGFYFVSLNLLVWFEHTGCTARFCLLLLISYDNSAEALETKVSEIV